MPVTVIEPSVGETVSVIFPEEGESYTLSVTFLTYDVPAKVKYTDELLYLSFACIPLPAALRTTEVPVVFPSSRAILFSK